MGDGTIVLQTILNDNGDETLEDDWGNSPIDNEYDFTTNHIG